MSSTRLVVCVGDSITKGQVSSNYVDRLARRYEPNGCRVVNAGVNGQLVYNVGLRLHDVIKLRPDVVTLLAGTNDVNSQFDDAWRARYRKEQKLPVDPNPAWYSEHVNDVLGRLTSQTDAGVAVLTIPPLGEDLGSRMNHLVNDHNAMLIEIAASHGVTVLPLHERLTSMLPSGSSPPPYKGDIRKIASAMAQHMVLRRSWDEVSRRNGLTLLTDHIHLNDTAAAEVADLISGFVEQQS